MSNEDATTMSNACFRWRTWRAIALFSLALTTSPSFAQSGSRTNGPRIQSQPNQSTGVAVVELFTSQGCNSCPSADAALRQIASVAEKNSLPVYVLSFHVDYWNRLGWKDPYSDSAYSNRQRAYAGATASSRIYTPQMIVGGTTEFVGSDKTKAHAAITKALASPVQSTVSLRIVEKSASNVITVGYSVAGVTEGLVLNFALVQTPKPNRVPLGENAGRELAHVNVVRAFETVPLAQSSGSVELQVPESVDASTAMVIAYAQSPKMLSVTGAASLSLSSVGGR